MEICLFCLFLEPPTACNWNESQNEREQWLERGKAMVKKGARLLVAVTRRGSVAAAKSKVIRHNTGPLFGTFLRTLLLFTQRQIRQKKCELLLLSRETTLSGEFEWSRNRIFFGRGTPRTSLKSSRGSRNRIFVTSFFAVAPDTLIRRQ